MNLVEETGFFYHSSADGFTKDSKLMTQTNANQWLIDPSQYKLFAWRSLGHIQRNPSQLKDIHVLRIVSLTKSITLIANNRTFSLTCPASMQINWNKRKGLRKKRVQLPEDWFGTPTWPPFYCFGTPIWPQWRQVKTLYSWECVLSQPSVPSPLDVITNAGNPMTRYWGSSSLTTLKNDMMSFYRNTDWMI